MDINSLLEETKGWYTPTIKNVNEEEVEKRMRSYAYSMSKAGYIFDALTLQALEAYSRGKNILLKGNVGTGKTFFFRCLNCGIIVLDMNQVSRWKFDRLEEFLNAYNDREMLIDDIGTGTARGNDWGSSYDVLLVILNKRMNTKARTHFTTNCSSEDIANAYGDRACDRLNGMAAPFVMTRKKSYRRA